MTHLTIWLKSDSLKHCYKAVSWPRLIGLRIAASREMTGMLYNNRARKIYIKKEDPSYESR